MRLCEFASLTVGQTELSMDLNRDRAVSGVAKQDGRDRVVDFHSLRHAIATNRSKVDVSPSVAQAAMCHSSIDLTMNVYTDPRLLDVQDDAANAKRSLSSTDSERKEWDRWDSNPEPKDYESSALTVEL